MMNTVFTAVATATAVSVMFHIFGTMSGFGREAHAQMIKNAFRKPRRARQGTPKASELSHSGRW